MADAPQPTSWTTGRVRRTGCELVVLTGTRLTHTVTARPSTGPFRTAPGQRAVAVSPAKSASVSSSVQSPTVPFEKRSSRVIITSLPS